MSSRKIKSQRKQDLRKKNLGVGLGKIEVDETPKNKKITFDDNFVASDYEESENDEKLPVDPNEGPSEGDEASESDDEIEQVSASISKQQAMDMFAAERKSRKEESAVSHKRKRRVKDIIPKSPPVEDPPGSDDNDDDELDEEFFAAVDEEREQNAKAKKSKRGILDQEKIGRHTTFVSDVGENNEPTDAGHNIEVVVLPGLSSEDGGGEEQNASRVKQAVALSARLGTEPSKSALLFCRGSHSIHAENVEKGFEVKRSRKAKYKLARGKPLGNFSIKRR